MEEQTEKTIRVGKGVVVWCSYRKGWALPGGRMTQVEKIARDAAIWIDENSQKRLIETL